MRLGVRWAETMRASNGTPSVSRISAAWRMVAQSDWLPMIRAPAGVGGARLAAGVRMCAQADERPMIRPTAGLRAVRLAVDLAILVSGDDIGNQLAFQLEDLVLETELALLQPLQLELVERRLLDQAVDHLVEVAVLALQGLKLGLDGLGVLRLRRRVAHALATLPCAVYPFAPRKGSTEGVGFSAPSVLEFLARALCRRGRRRGLPRAAGTARLRREHLAVLLLARRLGQADADRRPPARHPEGERRLAGRDRAALARSAPAV